MSWIIVNLYALNRLKLVLHLTEVNGHCLNILAEHWLFCRQVAIGFTRSDER
jgi:hypothetical protein